MVPMGISDRILPIRVSDCWGLHNEKSDYFPPQGPALKVKNEIVRNETLHPLYENP